MRGIVDLVGLGGGAERPPAPRKAERPSLPPRRSPARRGARVETAYLPSSADPIALRIAVGAPIAATAILVAARLLGV